MRIAYNFFIKKTEKRRPFRIKMDLKEMKYKSVDWLHLPKERNWQQALLNVAVNPQIP
jgi:hypothetical protein